jgi:AraC-like DNA-binding protein/quercetin dioxygenase-like cupin family protein
MSILEDLERSAPRSRGRLLPENVDGEVRRTAPGFRKHVHHSHSDVELNLVVRGTGAYAMDGGACELKPGTLIWITPNKPHRLIRKPQLEMWVVLFRAELFEPAWLEALSAQPSRQISSQELLSLDRLLGEVAQDSDEPAAYAAGIRYVLMRALRASQERPAAAQKAVHPAVGRAVRLMREGGAESSLSELAKAAGVTPHYLSRLLTEQTGRNFVDWRNRVRLDRFIERYRPGDNLLAAALDAGFGSYSRFHHTFTELVGCTPKDWVAQVDAGKISPTPDASAPVTGFGLHGSGMLLSPRQNWGAISPLASVWIRDLVGERFMERLLRAHPTDRPPAWMPATDQALGFAPGEIETLVASFRHQDPEAAAEYGRLMRSKDIFGTYVRFCANHDLPAAQPVTALGVVAGYFWWTLRDVGPDIPPTEALRRQIMGALGEISQRDPDTVRRGFVATVCHMVVLREATVAAHAARDPRSIELVRQSISQWSEAQFDGDLRTLEMSSDGYRSAARTDGAKARQTATA